MVHDYPGVLCLQVGVKSLETGVWGAYQNIQINLGEIKDTEFVSKVRQKKKHHSCCQDHCNAVRITIMLSGSLECCQDHYKLSGSL